MGFGSWGVPPFVPCGIILIMYLTLGLSSIILHDMSMGCIV